MQDPLSGTKATVDFISAMMLSHDEVSEVEKAGRALPDVDSLSPDARKVFDMSMEGFDGLDVDPEYAKTVSLIAAAEFDRKPSGGSDETPPEENTQKVVSTAGMSASLGSPSAEVLLTDTGAERKRRLGQAASTP